MIALPAIYLCGSQFRKNGIQAQQCAKSVALKMRNEPPLDDGPPWQFVSSYVPLVHGTRTISVFHDNEDKWVPLENIAQLAERPADATHVVKLLPAKLVRVPVTQQTAPVRDDCSAQVVISAEFGVPLFFFAVLREKGTENEHLALCR
jgi:hypothetical protein